MYPADADTLFLPRAGRCRRFSSYDRSGGNKDYFTLRPGETLTLADISGSGVIRHIWMTFAPVRGVQEALLPRKLTLRMYWDGEDSPSVEAPIGDFFGMGHGMTRNYTSALLSMSPEDGKSMTCYFPMPFRGGARITAGSDAQEAVKLYFYIDYTEEPLAEDALYFHAAWHRACPTEGVDDAAMDNAHYSFGGKNVTGDGNYEILSAKGKGHYVGCNFNVHNLRPTREWNWYGEGDDMIFVDGEQWPPSLHGTGTEDYFNTAWCPTQTQCGPYHGILLGGGPNWSGKSTYYRYHLLDPVMFTKDIRVTIEHGHNNHRSDDISSTAYWYQTEPHAPQPTLPPVEDRLPLRDIIALNPEMMDEVFGHDNP